MTSSKESYVSKSYQTSQGRSSQLSSHVIGKWQLNVSPDWQEPAMPPHLWNSGSPRRKFWRNGTGSPWNCNLIAKARPQPVYRTQRQSLCHSDCTTITAEHSEVLTDVTMPFLTKEGWRSNNNNSVGDLKCHRAECWLQKQSVETSSADVYRCTAPIQWQLSSFTQ